MLHNRIQSFAVPYMVGQPVPLQYGPFLSGTGQTPTMPLQVQIADIYEAARKRAIEEHELDKLFNPDFYDYQI
jgi:hypothetical protein